MGFREVKVAVRAMQYDPPVGYFNRSLPCSYECCLSYFPYCYSTPLYLVCE